MSKGSLITAANNGVNVDAILSPMKTYSRSSLAPLNLALSDNDSTEEECDNWDSAVSTTIDSVTNHHQKSVKPQAALQERKNGEFQSFVRGAGLPEFQQRRRHPRSSGRKRSWKTGSLCSVLEKSD